MKATTLHRALVIAATALSHRALAQPREPYPGLDTYIANAVQQWNIPGAAVAIVRNDSVIYAKGFGVLAEGSTAPVNERTLFEIGSCSKSFTATAIAMLVAEGKMRWDARVTEYLPGFRLNDPVANSAVTIRDALAHRSGIPRGELMWVGAGVSREDVLYRLRFLKPESPFRSQFSYQNVMYLAAGQAAGRAAGSSWDELIRQRILMPLGMTASVTTYRGLTNTNIATPHGVDHDTVFRRPPFNAEDIAPAGAIMSNAVDMAQWLRFQLNDGVVNGRRLVSSAALRDTHMPQMLMSAGARGGMSDTAVTTRFSTYGFGWIIEDYHRQLVWQHSGGTSGMTTAMGMLPEKRFGVVILSSMGQGALPEALRRYIFDRELGLPVRDVAAEAYTRTMAQRRRADSLTAVQETLHRGAVAPLPLSTYAGTFADSLYGAVHVRVKDGRLELERGEWVGALQFWSGTTFRWKVPPSAPTGPLFIKFDVSPANEVTGVYFGLGADVTLLGRVSVGRGGGRGT